jgi:MFS family permease
MPDDARILTALTTEHFGIAGARSQAASESASRSALYLGTVSSALIGLGLTAQVSGKRLEVFHVFALVALPTVFALGVFTFVRLVELGIEDFLLGRAINRIRHYYLELADGATKYFMLSGNDDATGVMANMGLEPARWQLYFTAAMAVGVVNAIVGGSAIAVAVGVGFDASLAVSVPVGVAAAFLIVIGAERYQRTRRDAGTRQASLFPSADALSTRQ